MKSGSAVTRRRMATILADYNFSSTARVDNLFHFVDCIDVHGRELARDVRAGVIPIQHRNVVIALGNGAKLDKYTSVARTVVAVINALVERYGCVGLQLVVLAILPRPMATLEETELLKEQNRSLFKVTRSLIRKKQYPIKYVPAYKWFLKRVENPSGEVNVQPDLIYFEEANNAINHDGQVHMHLLLAQMLKLKKISYEWSGMPLIRVKEVQSVSVKRSEGQSSGRGKGRKREFGDWKETRQLRKGHGNRRRSEADRNVKDEDDHSPPELVLME